MVPEGATQADEGWSNQQFNPDMMPMSHNNGHHKAIILRGAVVAYTYLGSNHGLSN